MDTKFTAALAVLLVILAATGAGAVMSPGSFHIGPLQLNGLPNGQGQQNTCDEGDELLVKFEWNNETEEFEPEGGDNESVNIFNVSTDGDNEPVSFNWTSEKNISYVRVKGGQEFEDFDGGFSGYVNFGTDPAISNMIFCIDDGTPTPTPEGTPTPTATPTSTPPPEGTPTPTPTPTPTAAPTPTATPTPTPTETPETVYWQVDFGEGLNPPDPPAYWPDDLMSALGNSEDGVTENPSVRRQRMAGQLENVTIVGNSYTFDDTDNPTSVTVEFEIEEGAPERDLHLAVFILPGPFDLSEVDQQELYEVTNGTFEGGDTGQLTVSIPQQSSGSQTSIGWTPGLAMVGLGLVGIGLTAARRREV